MKKEFGLWFWVHLSLLIPAYFSPLLVNWKLIIIGVVITQIQYWTIDGCIFTYIEMGKNKNETFVWHYLQKIYPNLNIKTTNFFIKFIAPVILITVGIVLQVKLGFKPLIRF